MAKVRAPRMGCCLPHSPAHGRPHLGISLLNPGPAQPASNMLQLLGLDNRQIQAEMEKDHPYVFNMGAGRTILFQDYTKAADELMARNLPDIVKDQQQEAVFVPETHLPNQPHVVDMVEYEMRKLRLTQVELQNLMLKAGREELQNAKGDMAEQDLIQALKRYYGGAGNKEVVVMVGPVFRKPGAGKGHIEEHDVVIIDKIKKMIICIESKATLTGRSSHEAIDQLDRMKHLLVQYFGQEVAAGDWCYVAMVHYNTANFKSKLPICPACLPFTIQGAGEVAARLPGLEPLLRTVRPAACSPSHPEYRALVQGLLFVVLAQPLGTYCTIVSAVNDKLVGKSRGGQSKARDGQGDLVNIIFWSMEQGNTMLFHHQFVGFKDGWSTGKTLCLREKALMLAAARPRVPVYFVVMRYVDTSNTTLLEMELEVFFRGSGVTVLGLSADSDDTLPTLHREITARPPGSWLVDELIIPESSNHPAWRTGLQQLRAHMTSQPGRLLLWIAISGISDGQKKHFEPAYLQGLLPGFHIPSMDLMLRNTQEVAARAGLRNRPATAGPLKVTVMRSNPSYRWLPNMMAGVPCPEFLVQDPTDRAEVEERVEAASRAVRGRTGDPSLGIPVLYNGYPGDKTEGWIVSGLQRGRDPGSPMPLLYTRMGRAGEASGANVAGWLERWRRGEEQRDLLTDADISRGWEAKYLVVVDLGTGGSNGWENLVMRTIGMCSLVRKV